MSTDFFTRIVLSASKDSNFCKLSYSGSLWDVCTCMLAQVTASTPAKRGAILQMTASTSVKCRATYDGRTPVRRVATDDGQYPCACRATVMAASTSVRRRATDDGQYVCETRCYRWRPVQHGDVCNVCVPASHHEWKWTRTLQLTTTGLLIPLITPAHTFS